MFLLFTLAALPGCADKGAGDSGAAPAFAWPDRGADPWEGLPAVPPDPLRYLSTTPLLGSAAPTRLLPIGRRALTGVLDPGDGAIQVLDSRYHYSRSPVCVDPADFPGYEIADRQGSCPGGQVELNRGRLAPPGGLVAGAADEEGLAFYAISRDGRLLRAEADVLRGHPFDFLRLDDGLALEDAAQLPEGGVARVADGRIWLAHGETLSAWSLEDGALLDRVALPGTASDLAWIDGGMWAVTDGGLRTGDGEVLDIVGSRIAALEGTAWVTLPESDTLRALGAQELTIPVEGLLAGIAADAGTGKLYLATTEGIAVLRDGVEIARYAADAPADLAVAGSHEILSLDAEGAVAIYLDEQALEGPEPLDIVPITFFEKPRSPEEDLGCRYSERTGDQNVRDNVDRAMANMPLLQDLPGRFAFALIPWAAQRIADCGEAAAFEPVWDNDFVEHGVLFHQEYADCGEDQACQQAALLADYQQVTALGLRPTWTTGLTPHVDSGMDWARALVAIGAPDRFLFFGASILPDIPHHTDPRAKEAYPFEAADRSAAWRIDSAYEAVPGDPDGAIAIYPGDSVAAFTQSGCANVFIQECRLVGGGGGQRLKPEDIAVLRLMLHRALAARRDGQVDTWSFHLPDLGAFDYVTGCTETERVWTASGEEACQAQLLQEWMLDVHQRYVLNGLARWALPSALARP